MRTCSPSDGTIELAQRGMYIGRERVRGFLFNVFGKEGPQENRLGNHIQWQPVIHVAADGQSAKVALADDAAALVRPRASLGASIYENEFVKEDGVWKFRVDPHVQHVAARLRWRLGRSSRAAAACRARARRIRPTRPPSFTFQMFPTVYEIPFHYAHPVTGKRRESRRRTFLGAPEHRP